jgi:hypothetical protein
MSLWRKRWGAGCAALLLTATVAVSVQAVTSSTAFSAPTGAGDNAPQSVIVVLKDQLTGTPADAAHMSARRSAAHDAQHAVLTRLSGAAATKVKDYTSVNGFAATVTTAQAQALAADPAVAAVFPDRSVSIAPVAATTPAATPKAVAPNLAPNPAPGACPSDPAKPILEPEALQTTRTAFEDPSTPSAQQIATGRGVKVAFIADGLDPNLTDFVRADGSKVIVDYQDFSGEGPNSVTSGAEAFGDASAIAAQGRGVYDVANFVNPAYALPAGCDIRVLGMAPGASVIAIKAGGELLPNSAILQAIDYAISKHVDVLNESFGGNVTPDNSTRDTIQLFNHAATQAGITVTVSSGDAGITGTIGSPSTNPDVISVGASTNSRIYAQTGYAAFRFTNGTWANDNISALSSGGFTEGGRTMDLVAPGEAAWALCSTSAQFVGCNGFNGRPSPIQPFGGTSQSAPLTAGAAALVIEAYRNAHNGASPSPALVKQILITTSQDLGLPAEEQGAGELDARAAVEAATTIGKPNTARPGIASNVIVSPYQEDITAQVGQSRSATVTVTNVGTKDQTISTGTRTFATLRDTKQTVALNSTSDPTFPYATTGAPWAYKLVTFNVPAGADRLGAALAWQGAALPSGVTPVVRMTLIDPTGRFQTNTRPQGGAVSANFGFVDVRAPKSGTWTAVLYTVAGAAGYVGNVRLEETASRAVPAGNANPATLRLKPGQSGQVKVALAASDASGDSSESITIGSSGGHQTSIPVVLRTLVGIHNGQGSFTGTITGGNARSFAPAETFGYAFDVPAGRPDLNLNLALQKDPGVLLEGVLIDPNGEPTNIGTNTGGGASTLRTMQQVVANPIPGRWRFILIVVNPVSGKQLAQQFTGVVSFAGARASLSGLPGTLRAGQATTVKLRYTNTGSAPVLLQVDPRLKNSENIQLAPQGSSATLQLPLTPTSTVPAYFVPPATDKLTLAATSTTPAQVELSAPGGGIDVFGDLGSAQRGDTVSVARVSESHGASIAQGAWLDFVQQIGPFSGPAPAGTSTLVATAHTRAFDPDVTSSTGDFWPVAYSLSADTGNPAVVKPGQTVTVTVTFTPHGPKGKTVSGDLLLVTPPSFFPTFNASGDVIASLPYSYTIG